VNKSKKLQVKKEKKERLIEQRPLTQISLPWLIGAGIIIVALVVALLFDQLYKPTLMTIDGKSYNISDLAYYFYTVESRYGSYSSIFGDNSYWDLTIDEESGQTVRDSVRDEAVQLSLQYEILYNEAVSAGYTLTDEEKKTIDENAARLLSNGLAPAVIRKNNFTKKYLTDILGRITLAERFREDKIDELAIDVEEIKKGIDYEEYRQYDIEYFSISTKKYDDDGNYVDLSDEEKKAAYDKIAEVYEKAKTTDDWSTLLSDDETELSYIDDDNFTKNDTRYSDDMKAKLMAMENGEISEIIEEEDAYYFVRMINNNSSERYDSAVDLAVTNAENEAFTEYYNNEILPKHNYTIIDKALKKYKMGNVTI